ncbi:UDP-N-acetylmuramoyl-tripeptide--D-alanyl-D-alanine ligase [Marinospirillum sp.]|uniref:UDP-N-acetylmuramoyl-tripeptide--D-alanyl-D- alanine ligase n=1 Tax=Marinospirillum sp. TaxID=2183934 RepID=UPI003A840EBB
MLIHSTVAQTAAFLEAPWQGTPEAGDQLWTSVTLDSRQIQPGALFAALRGVHQDGHAYLDQAAAAGACVALVEAWQPAPLAQIKVPCVRRALGQLAQQQRAAFHGSVIAITGNSGKTSVKTLVAHLLSHLGAQVCATRGNLNNDLGVPLTLFGLEPQHSHAVIELGANHLGEIDYLAGLVQPNVALITNVTGAHLGEFGSLEAIAQAKGELLAHVQSQGTAVLSADDVFFPYWKKQLHHASAQLLTYGLHQGDLCVAPEIQLDLQATQALLCVDQQRIAFTLDWPGRHNLSNALAALAVLRALGCPLVEAARALAHLPEQQGRLHQSTTYAGAQLLDDSYNASPGAVKAALATLALWSGPRWLVLGDLAELGEASAQIHRELGEEARRQGVVRLFALGCDAALAAEAFGDGGAVFAHHQALADALKQELNPQTCVLVKGSRRAGMDQVIQYLTASL